MEISRWSSEPGERTPPDRAPNKHAPRQGREERFFRHPCRGGCHLEIGNPVVFASLDHRLISFHPPGEQNP